MEPVFVERLRVTASAPLESPVGFAARVEDALRTATLPAEWRSRCVLVRKLRLRAGQGWPAHRIARRLESLWRDAGTYPVHASVASSAASAVWFEDETSARLALIERLAQRKDVSAWFWQRLLPAGDLELQIARLASDCLRDAHSARIGQDFAAVCQAIGEPALVDRVIALIDPALMYPLFPGAALPASKFDDHCVASAAGSAALSQGRDGEVRELARQVARAARCGASTRGDVDRRTESSTARGDSIAALGQWSEWAGIFFALNLLRRADAPPRLDPVAALRAIASWLRVAPDDPLLARLDELDLRDRPQTTDPEPDAAALLRLRIACLRATRRPLRRVLRRGGRIALNRTHLTVSFRLAEVSLPVRVAGFDIDPGWIEPLARVVRFEYD